MMPDKRLIDANALVDKVRLDWGLTHQSQLISASTKLAAADAMCKMLGEVAKCQTIDAVPVVHGRWEKVQVWKDNPQTTLRCSLCKTNQPIYEHEEWKFCPFCGQPMDAKDMDVPTKDGGAR